MPLLKWFPRYLQLKKLIETCAGDQHSIRPDTTFGKYVAPQHKKPIHFILFVALIAFYALVMTPFLATVNDPVEHAAYLHVSVADFDGGPVGQAFTDFVKAIPQTIGPRGECIDALLAVTCS